MLEIVFMLLTFLVVMGVCISVLFNWLLKDMPECNGSCYQGRQPCTCKKVDKKVDKNGI